MKDLAYQIVGLYNLHMESIENDAHPDVVFDLQWELQESALALATIVATHDPLEGHTRLGEVFAYAKRNDMCVHEAIVSLVNAALSDGHGK